MDQIQNEASIYEGYKSSVRNDIKVAQTACVLNEEKDAKVLLSLHQASLFRKGKTSKDQSKILEQLILSCFAKDKGFVLSIYHDDLPVCAAFVAMDDKWAYLLALGLDKKKAPRGAIQYLLHECIRRAAQKVDQFDFEGIMQLSTKNAARPRPRVHLSHKRPIDQIPDPLEVFAENPDTLSIVY